VCAVTRAPVNLYGAESSRARAREGRAEMSDVGQQSDPLAPRAALRGCWPPAQLSF